MYMDNIFIATAEDYNYHRSKVHWTLDTLDDNNLYVNPEKCTFKARCVE